MIRLLYLLSSFCPEAIKKLCKRFGWHPVRIALRWLSPWYEPDVRKVIKRIVRPGWTCADVGANVGIITELLAQLVGQHGLVVAFEPYPENILELSRNVARKKYQGRVRIENIAVSDGSSDNLWLFPGPGRGCTEWNIIGDDLDGNKTKPELMVRAASLDSLFPKNSRLDFVKIDVEGGGAKVLAGMKRLLRTTRPIVLMEFHNEIEWASRREFFSAHYDLYNTTGIRIVPENNVQLRYHCYAIPQPIQE